MSFQKMNQKPKVEPKIKVSRLQTMQFWRHLKWCHLPLFAFVRIYSHLFAFIRIYLHLFARSLRWPSYFLQLDFAV
jgi:hypothetical protein